MSHTIKQNFSLQRHWVGEILHYKLDANCAILTGATGRKLFVGVVDTQEYPRNTYVGASVQWTGKNIYKSRLLNTLKPRQNGRRFADDIFKCIFLNENVWIPIKISLKFVPGGPISNIPALVQIMAWRRPGDKPLSEAMTINFVDGYMRHSASMS